MNYVPWVEAIAKMELLVVVVSSWMTRTEGRRRNGTEFFCSGYRRWGHIPAFCRSCRPIIWKIRRAFPGYALFASDTGASHHLVTFTSPL